MGDRIATHGCLFSVFSLILGMAFIAFAMFSATLHLFHQEYWLKEGPWRAQYRAFLALPNRLDYSGERIGSLQDQLRTYPTDHPARAAMERQIQEYRRQQLFGLGQVVGSLFVVYLLVYAALKSGMWAWQRDLLRLRYWLPRLVVGWIGWIAVAMIFTLPLARAIPAATSDRYDPLRVDVPVEQTDDYWRARVEGARRHSLEWDLAVRNLAAVQQNRVERWFIWFQIVFAVYALVAPPILVVMARSNSGRPPEPRLPAQGITFAS